MKKTLYFNRLYGRPPDEENQKTWDEMRPRKYFLADPLATPLSTVKRGLTRVYSVGRGFIVLKNDTALPDMPALHQEVPEQHAMVSAFHQMHCVVSPPPPWCYIASRLTKVLIAVGIQDQLLPGIERHLG